MTRGFDTIIFIYTKNPTAPAGNRTQGLRTYVILPEDLIRSYLHIGNGSQRGIENGDQFSIYEKF